MQFLFFLLLEVPPNTLVRLSSECGGPFVDKSHVRNTLEAHDHIAANEHCHQPTVPECSATDHTNDSVHPFPLTTAGGRWHYPFS